MIMRPLILLATMLCMSVAFLSHLAAEDKSSASVKTSQQRLVIGRESDTITLRGSRVPVVTWKMLEASNTKQEQPNRHPETQTPEQSTQVSPKEGLYQN